MQAAVNLQSTAGFVILAGSLVSNIQTSAITGDVGLSPAARSFITGFGLTEVTGTIYAADDIFPADVPAMLTAAKGDLTTAYNDAAGRISTDIVILAGNLGGLTLTPGLYKWSSVVSIPSNVTLAGGANDVWIFQIAQGLTVGNGAIVTLSGGAQAKNIFWQVAGQTTLGTTSNFKGIVLCQTAIVLNSGAVINGRALAQTAVTLIANTITAPVIEKKYLRINTIK